MADKKRLIDVDALEAHFRKTKIIEVFPNWKELNSITTSAIIRLTAKYRAIIASAPIVDAVEVVRCKDCSKRYNPNECPMCILVYGEQHDFTHDQGYCDRGERRTDAEIS